MKKYLFILFLVALFSSKVQSQGVRKCPCQTWKEWNSSTPVHEESKRERIKNYEKYKKDCMAICNQKNKMGKTKQ